MTTVCGRVARPLGLESFADITEIPVAQDGLRRDGITFAGDLTPEETSAVYERMTSRDDDDMTARANLRTLLAAAEAGDLEDIRALTVAAMRYWLGETP